MSQSQPSLFPVTENNHAVDGDQLQYVNIVIPPLPQRFTYSLLKSSSLSVSVGDRVTVPFGRRAAVGFVVEAGVPGSQLLDRGITVKQISSKQEVYRCFDPNQIPLFNWVASYYGDTLSNVIDVAVPHPAHNRYDTLLTVNPERQADSLRGKTQKILFHHLAERSDPTNQSELLKRFPGASASLKKLISEGFVLSSKESIMEQFSDRSDPPSWAKSDLSLNELQNLAVEQISRLAAEHSATPILLHGITGSGKTEVYIESIKEVMKRDQSALILVPEIALTPQLIDRFRARLGNDLAVLHSGLSRRARWNSWSALLQGRSRVAIGARSGVFAPIQNLGLIVVDEEHDASYKQSDGLRYNARDVAIVRASLAQCPIVLGTATPSLETYYHAVKKKYHYLSLPSRPQATQKLSIEIIDLNRVKPWEMPSKNLSPYLVEEITKTLASGKQAFILYNRRGFASYLQCETCEAVLECPNCSVTLTYHRSRNTLLCHYCNLNQVPPSVCPQCTKKMLSTNLSSSEPSTQPGILSHRGAGTERVFDEIQALFPDVAIDRLDRDAVSDLEHYRSILDRVRSGATQILVGTQMIAKGHDIAGVRLVGVVDCDVGLHMPDFRAAERAFQLLTQVAGRAGRGDEEGKVVLQTRVPKHPSLTTTKQQSYIEFARSELNARKAVGNPPFSRLLRVVALSPDKEEAGVLLKMFRESVHQFLQRESLKVITLGPALAPLERIKAHWRWHLLFKSRSSKSLHKVRAFIQSLPVGKKTRLVYDMDPQEML